MTVAISIVLGIIGGIVFAAMAITDQAIKGALCTADQTDEATAGSQRTS